jgi:hypothetical protein
MTPAQQQVLFENTARSIGDAPREIQIRHIRHMPLLRPTVRGWLMLWGFRCAKHWGN